MISKNNALIFSGIGTIIFFAVAHYVLNVNGCQDTWFFCRDLSSWTADTLRLFPVLFLFCLITYWLRIEIFVTWTRFVNWMIPVCVLLILIAPADEGGWMFPHDKGRVSLALTALFFVASALIIAWKYWRLRKRA